MPETKETIGQRLKNIRLSRQISLDKAAQATRVRIQYLQALEEDNYSSMSSAAQGRGFLRLYADFLGLDLDAAMEDLRREEPAETPPEAPAPAPEPEPAPQTTPASPPDGTAARRPFWARLLRQNVPEEATETVSAPEPGQESPVEPVVASEPEPEPAPEPLVEQASIPATVEEPAVKSSPKKASSAKGKKSKAPASTSASKSKPAKAAKSTAKSTDKKKASVKKTSSKKSR